MQVRGETALKSSRVDNCDLIVITSRVCSAGGEVYKKVADYTAAFQDIPFDCTEERELLQDHLEYSILIWVYNPLYLPSNIMITCR